jgi:hypothetical protein
MLTTHEDDSVTLSEKRSHVCLEASWELEAMSELLTKVAMHGALETNAAGYQVRCISSRPMVLASAMMSGLSDEQMPTDDLERKLKATG